MNARISVLIVALAAIFVVCDFSPLFDAELALKHSFPLESYSNGRKDAHAISVPIREKGMNILKLENGSSCLPNDFGIKKSILRAYDQ